MGPQRWRPLCLPGLKRLIRGVKQLGKPFIKHCDGNINPIVEDLVEAGIDCIDPIDTSAGVELADIKARFGDRVAIKGGVPVTLLCDGDPQQVRDLRERVPRHRRTRGIHPLVHERHYRERQTRKLRRDVGSMARISLKEEKTCGAYW